MESCNYQLTISLLLVVLSVFWLLSSSWLPRYIRSLSYSFTLYLIIVALLEPVVSILDVLPVYRNGTAVAVRVGFEGFCSLVDFLSVVVTLMELLVICCIVLCYGASVRAQC